jgi:hypothetical protein
MIGGVCGSIADLQARQTSSPPVGDFFGLVCSQFLRREAYLEKFARGPCWIIDWIATKKGVFDGWQVRAEKK